MKALVYQGPGVIRAEDVPVPGPLASGDALVRVTTAAICGSDLHVLHGLMPGMERGIVVGLTADKEQVGEILARLKREASVRKWSIPDEVLEDLAREVLGTPAAAGPADPPAAPEGGTS